MEENKKKLLFPAFSIAVTSEMTDVSPVMIREYEKAGLIKPARVKGKRRFSECDVDNIKLIRYYLHDRNMTIPGLKTMIQVAACHEFKKCGEEDCVLYGKSDGMCYTVISKRKKCDQEFCPSCPIQLIKSSAEDKTDGPPHTPHAFHK